MRYIKNDVIKRDKNRNLFAIWILVGIVFSYALAAMHLTKAEGVKQFFDVGKVQDFYDRGFSYARYPNGATYELSEDYVAFHITMTDNDQKWNYVTITFSNVATSIENACIMLFDENENEDKVFFTLEEGINNINVKGIPFYRAKLVVPLKEDTTFQVKSVSLRNQKAYENLWQRLTKRSIVFFSGYLILSFIMFIILKKTYSLWGPVRKKITPLVWIQTFFGFITNHATKITKYIPNKWKRILRTALFFFIIMIYNLAEVKIFTWESKLQRTIVMSVIMLLIAFLMMEKKEIYKKWNASHVTIWFLFSLMMIGSDLVVTKLYMYAGLVQIFVFGFFAFAWQTMKNKEELFKEIFVAVHCHFVYVVIFCSLFRPNVEYRYMGAYAHPVTSALNIAIICIISMVGLSNCLTGKKFKWATIGYAFEFIMTMIYIWKTQTRNALLAIFGVLVFLVIRQAIYVYKNKNWKNTVLVIACIGIMFYPVQMGNEWILNHVPQKIGYDIKFENEKILPLAYSEENYHKLQKELDIYQVREVVSSNPNMGMQNIVMSTTIKESRIFSMFDNLSLEGITNGRSKFWVGYTRKMNLFGHYNYEKVVDKKQNAHCALFQVPYRYGVFTVVPYIIMLFLVFMSSVQHCFAFIKGKVRDYDLLPLAVTILYAVFALLDVAEFLYYGVIWILFYMIVGYLFVTEDKEQS